MESSVPGILEAYVRFLWALILDYKKGTVILPGLNFYKTVDFTTHGCARYPSEQPANETRTFPHEWLLHVANH